MKSLKKNLPSSAGVIRISPDLGVALSAITMDDPSQTIAQIIDPLIRPELERRYAALPSHVRQTVEARAKKSREAKAAKQSA